MTGRTRRLRHGAAASAAALGIASVAAAAAFGHIPGVGNGLAPTTNGPDLRSVEVFGSDLNDVLPEQARYCFDQNLANVVAGPAGGFFALQTYDSRRAMNPTVASRDTSNEKCAIASFAAGTDITQATVGEVVPGAVSDLQSRTNTIAIEPATGSVHAKAAGSTTGPDLTDVKVSTANAEHKLVTFEFDENLNPAPAAAYQASDFGFYNAAEAQVFAPVGGVSISGKSATVDFLNTAQVETAARFVIRGAAVQDRPQTNSIGGLPLTTASSPDVFNKGAVSAARPEMTSAVPIGARDLRITFNVAVQFDPGSAALIFAISDDGSTATPATSVGTGGTGNTVIATFPASVAEDPGGIVRIFINPGAVTTVGGALINLAGQQPTSTPNSAPGFTNGPDLLAVGVDAVTSRVTYKYDEAVQDGPAPAVGAFQGAAVDGAPINALGGVVVSGNLVTALFPPSVISAVMFANPFATVPDKTGRVNPHQSVSNQIQVGPPAPPPPPGPPPPPPPPATAKPRFKTTVTISRRGRIYRGTVKSARKACRQGRRVILKRRNLDARFGTAFSGRTGKYTIKRRKRLNRPNVYVYVTGRSTSINCLPAKSKRIRG